MRPVKCKHDTYAQPSVSRTSLAGSNPPQRLIAGLFSIVRFADCDRKDFLGAAATDFATTFGGKRVSAKPERPECCWIGVVNMSNEAANKSLRRRPQLFKWLS